MEFTGVTYWPPRTYPEELYPPGVFVENRLRVWVISRWRSQFELAREFLASGYRHLNRPAGMRPMFSLDETRDNLGNVVMLTATFANSLDARFLLGTVWWCGCEFIAFTMYNMYTNYDAAFPTPRHVHRLPYNINDEE